MALKKILSFAVEKYKNHQEYLLEWQNEIMHSHEPLTELYMDKEQLQDLTIQQMQSDYRIMSDCAHIVSNTKKPDVFFMRLNLLLEKCEHLKKLDKYVPFSSIVETSVDGHLVTAQNLYDDIITNYHKAIQEFLIRYFTAILDKVDTLKTSKGKLRQYENFYSSLQPYYSYMNDEHIDYIETKYNAYTNLEIKEK